MNSTRGRPRALTDAQVAEVLAWYKSRKTLVQVAREHGVSTETIRNLIRCGGVYKQPSPELRAAVVQARRELVKSWDRPLGLKRRRARPPSAQRAPD
jgi:transposase-like protein